MSPRYALRKSLDTETLKAMCKGKTCWRIKEELGESFIVVKRHLQMLVMSGEVRLEGKRYYERG